MNAAFLQLRLIHSAYIVTMFLFIFVIRVTNPPEQAVPIVFPVVMAILAVSIASVGLMLRKQFLHSSAAALALNPEDPKLLQRWRVGNLISFCFAEATMLLGVVLKFMGEQWKIVLPFFAAGLLLLVLWTPRKIQAMPRGVR
jgi:hypothetical protein